MHQLIDNTKNHLYAYKQRLLFSLFPSLANEECSRLLPPPPETTKRVGHVAVYTQANAGDTLLPRTVRDSIDKITPFHWDGINAHKIVGRRLLSEINHLDGLVIGGGGLFLRDTNPNRLSGWQWSCSTDALSRIEIPIALFSVGYNRFRGQPDFKPIFRRHLELLARKSTFIGMRNTGSIKAIQSYLPKELHHKIRFQPCTTTLCRILYPELCQVNNRSSKPLIALNCAFDRINLRLGKRTELILNELAVAIKTLSENCLIAYYAHSKKDHHMLPYLDRHGVDYTLVDLFSLHPKKVVEAYSKASLAIGMRGHAQMIPFGCGTPILSLVSHDKIRWFLDDIERPHWGIEMLTPGFANHLLEVAENALETTEATKQDIQQIQINLLATTLANASDFISAL